MTAIPMAMGFAMAMGLRPEQGIIAGAVACIVGRTFGGSKYQVYGPTAAFIPVIAALMAKYGEANGGSFESAHGFLVLCSIIAGVVLMIMGLAGLGKIRQARAQLDRRRLHGRHRRHHRASPTSAKRSATRKTSTATCSNKLSIIVGQLARVQRLRLLPRRADVLHDAVPAARSRSSSRRRCSPSAPRRCSRPPCSPARASPWSTTSSAQIPTNFFVFTPPVAARHVAERLARPRVLRRRDRLRLRRREPALLVDGRPAGEQPQDARSTPTRSSGARAWCRSSRR